MADTMPGPLTRSFTASLRRSLLAALIPMVTALVPAVAQAQTPPDIPDPSEVLYEIRLADGSRVIARVVELDEVQVVFMTAGGSRLAVERSQIRGLRPARGRFEKGEFWNEDPGGTRLLFTATGRTLSRGESYIGTYVVVLPFAAVGVTDRVTIAAGAPVLFGNFEPFYVAPKAQIFRSPQAQVSLGTLAFFFDDEVVGVAYGVGTFGSGDEALSAGLGYFYSGEEVVNEPAFMLGGETRVSRRIKFITENYLLPDAVGLVLSGGIRIIGDRFNTEIAVVGVLADADTECCLPILNFSYSFGR